MHSPLVSIENRPSMGRAPRLRFVAAALIGALALSVPTFGETRPHGVPEGAVFVSKAGVWVLDSSGRRTVFRGNGAKQAEGEYRLKQREGAWTFYYPNGNTRGAGAFQSGRMQGDWKLYHDNGKTESFGKYENNYRVGLWTFYTDSGRKRAEGMYHDGYRTGAWTEYYDSGKIFYTGAYLKNREHGEFKYFTEAGTLVQAGRFANGVRVGQWYICAGGTCGKQTFKQSEVPRFSGGVSGPGQKSSGPNELLDVLDGKKKRKATWR